MFPAKLVAILPAPADRLKRGKYEEFFETFVILTALAILSGNVLATDDIFNNNVDETSVTSGSNTITIENNVKYVNYVLNDVLHVTLDYTATCNVVVTDVQLRSKAFTPKNVAGNIANKVFSPVGGSGSVSFDLQFTALKKAGKSKNFGMAHLNLLRSEEHTSEL